MKMQNLLRIFGMKKNNKNTNLMVTLLLMAPLLNSCNVDFKRIEARAEKYNHYEEVALKLARENRELRTEVKRLEFEIEKLKQDKAFHDAKVAIEGGHGDAHGDVHGESHSEGAHGQTHETPVAEVAHETSHEEKGRSIASVAPIHHDGTMKDKDIVEFKVYKWRAEDMLQIADKEFKEKHYEKAAQFYASIVEHYPHFKAINDEFYFRAGIASFESGNHHEWTLEHFEALMHKYPTSHFYRSAKLWVALTNLKLGEKKKFFATVEEFRKKYRNTSEWKILSAHYEKIEEKTSE